MQIFPILIVFMSPRQYIYIPKTTIFIGNYAFYQAGIESAYFEDYTGWNFVGTFNNGYPDYFKPVGLAESAKMLSNECTTINSTKYTFYKNNIEKSDAYINVNGSYSHEVGTRD